jgi:hypothetical protein
MTRFLRRRIRYSDVPPRIGSKNLDAGSRDDYIRRGLPGGAAALHAAAWWYESSNLVRSPVAGEEGADFDL